MLAVSRHHRCKLLPPSLSRRLSSRRIWRRTQLAWLLASTTVVSSTAMGDEVTQQSVASAPSMEAAVSPPVVGGTPVLMTSPLMTSRAGASKAATIDDERSATAPAHPSDVSSSAMSMSAAKDAGPLLRIAERGSVTPSLGSPDTVTPASPAADPPSISSLPRLPKSQPRLVTPPSSTAANAAPPAAVVQPQLGARPTLADAGNPLPAGETRMPPVSTLGPTPAPVAADAPDAEIARRPWLLDKVFGNKSDEVERMNPPMPPSDPGIPPSMRTLGPNTSRNPATDQPAENVGSPSSAAGSAAKTDQGWVSADRSPLQPIQTSPPLRSLPDVNATPDATSGASSPDIGPEGSEPAGNTQGPTRAPAKDQPIKRLPLRDAPVQIKIGDEGATSSVTDAESPEDSDRSRRPSAQTGTPELSAPATDRAELSAPATDRAALSAPAPLKIEKRRVEIPAVGPDRRLMADLEPLPALAVAPKKMPQRTSRETPPQRNPSEMAGRSPAKGFAGDSKSLADDSNDTVQDSRGNEARTEPSPRVGSRPPASSSVESRPSAVALDYVGMPKSAIRMTRNVQRMQYSIRSVLTHSFNRPEVADRRSNWGMMHSMMVYGADTQVIVGRKRYSTIAWIAGNNACRGQRIFDLDEHGLFVRSGAGLQGHQGQLLTMFALAGVPQDYPIYCNGKRFSVADIVRREMDDCVSGNELTFTLIALSHYLDSDEVWRSRDGETWSIARLIREELSQPIVGAACGGTHRLMAFAHAIRMRRRQGRPIDGQWRRAEIFTQDFVKYAYGLQNRDGSMGTAWFEGRQDNGDIDRKLQTTGHIVEWLLTVTPDSQLQNPRLVSAVNFLNRSIRESDREDANIGPRGHALRSLAMYYERVYARGVAWKPTAVATHSTATRRR